MPHPPSKAKVYFAGLRADSRRNLFDKLDGLLEAVSLADRFKKGHLVAVKLHFGETGNAAFIPPVFVRRVVERIKAAGANPFLTDTNTLYVGTRGNSVSHLKTAIENGFAYAVAGAPVIIADGLRGEGVTRVKINGRHFKEASIASEIANADGLVVLTHFKCHEMSGFGGALKNVGMGCAARAGKLAQHSNCAPVVDPAGCTACGECSLHCPADAIDVGAAAVINANLCIGCGHCIAACPESTIDVRWDETAGRLQEKMVDYACAALKGKEGRAVYVSFVRDVSPACDCYGHNDAPIVPDAGILASTDPVAIDQACADIVNAETGFKNTALASGHEPGGDKFRGVHPAVDWGVQLDAAEAAGIGVRRYALEKI
ncbi:MAG: DUF362 domain-containing protein [Deltaproteobacteria bacterium]|nr:DUF362 domain-containing protein [Deltaproteobacteria bacterium]